MFVRVCACVEIKYAFLIFRYSSRMGWIEYSRNNVTFRSVLKVRYRECSNGTFSAIPFNLCQSHRWGGTVSSFIEWHWPKDRGNLGNHQITTKRLIEAHTLFSIAWSGPYRMSQHSSCARQRALCHAPQFSLFRSHYFLSDLMWNVLPSSPS